MLHCFTATPSEMKEHQHYLVLQSFYASPFWGMVFRPWSLTAWQEEMKQGQMEKGRRARTSTHTRSLFSEGHIFLLGHPVLCQKVAAFKNMATICWLMHTVRAARLSTDDAHHPGKTPHTFLLSWLFGPCHGPSPKWIAVCWVSAYFLCVAFFIFFFFPMVFFFLNPWLASYI